MAFDPLSLITTGLQNVPTPASGLMPFINTAKNDAMEMASTKNTRDYNMKLWNMQNAYNSPAQQMARLKAAGLNTNLMYSQGNTGQAAPPTPGSPAHYKDPEDMSPMATNAYLQAVQAQLVEQQTKTEKAKTTSAEADASVKSGLAQYLSHFNADNEVEDQFGNKGRMSNQWFLLNAKTKEALARLGITQANQLNASTLAELNSQLRPYFMTINDPLWARMLNMGLTKKVFTKGQAGHPDTSLMDLIKSIF